MVKRRLATAKKYRKRPLKYWKETAFQDESNVELWQRGPPRRWFKEEDLVDGRRKTQALTKKGGGKLNFSLLFCHSSNPVPKAKAFVYETNFNADMPVKMIKKQWLPFFTANPNVKRLVIDADPNHPGNRRNQSKQVCDFFNEHFPHVELVSGPCLWDSETGVELSEAEQKARGWVCARSPPSTPRPGTSGLRTAPT